MKKTLLTLIIALSLSMSKSQTAVDFTTTDCASASHTLFTELDAGKVIVLCWVMPCGACIGSASTDATTVQGYANPNVVFYLVDDTGGSCSTLSSWASTNGITTNAIFSNAGNVIKMTDYGSTGMPKTIVLGGTSHSVFYNVNGTVTSGGLTTAINNALATGITENTTSPLQVAAFPNPSSTKTKITYSLINSSEVTIDVLNLLGEKVNSVSLGKQAAGKQEFDLNTEVLTTGSYLVKINTGELTETIKLTVAR